MDTTCKQHDIDLIGVRRCRKIGNTARPQPNIFFSLSAYLVAGFWNWHKRHLAPCSSVMHGVSEGRSNAAARALRSRHVIYVRWAMASRHAGRSWFQPAWHSAPRLEKRCKRLQSDRRRVPSRCQNPVCACRINPMPCHFHASSTGTQHSKPSISRILSQINQSLALPKILICPVSGPALFL